MQGHGLGLAAIAQAGAFGSRDVQRVNDAAEPPIRGEGTGIPLPAGIGERDQMPR